MIALPCTTKEAAKFDAIILSSHDPCKPCSSQWATLLQAIGFILTAKFTFFPLSSSLSSWEREALEHQDCIKKLAKGFLSFITGILDISKGHVSSVFEAL